MKISIDARGARLYSGTGIGTYTYHLVKHLLEMDTRNAYLLFWHGGYFEPFCKENVEFYLTARHQKHFWDEDYIPYHLNQKAPKIHHIPQNGISMPKDSKHVYISTIHDLIPYILPKTVGSSYVQKFQAEMPYIVNESSHILTVSEWSKKDLLYLFDLPEDKITVTPLAANDCFQPLPQSIAKIYIEKKYKIKEDFILYLGGFSKRKNLHGLLQAFADIHPSFTRPIKLVLLGQGKEEWKNLKELAASLRIEEKVIFTGFVEELDLPYFYNSASVFVYPSLYEGFGLPVLEAMSCGTPTIASSVTSIPEVAGDAGLLVHPQDIDALGKAILKVVETPSLQEELKRKGLDRAKQFHWKKTAQKTLEVYEMFK